MLYRLVLVKKEPVARIVELKSGEVRIDPLELCGCKHRRLWHGDDGGRCQHLACNCKGFEPGEVRGTS